MNWIYKTISVISLLLIALNGNGFNQARFDAEPNDAAYNVSLPKQYSLVQDTMRLKYQDQIISQSNGKEAPFSVTDVKEITKEDQSFYIITGCFRHWTARRTFYACAKKVDGSLLWIKSNEEACGSNHTQGLKIDINEKLDRFNVYTSHLGKSHVWNDSMANDYGIIEISILNIEKPEIVSIEIFEPVQLGLSPAFNGLYYNRDAVNQIELDVIKKEPQIDVKVKVWPNPTQQFLHIDLDDSPDNMVLMDTKGRIVIELKSTDNKVNVAKLADGLYFLVLNYADNTQTLKFTKG